MSNNGGRQVFHSRRSSRRRRRHANLDTRTEQRWRTGLNRATVLIAAIIGLAILGTIVLDAVRSPIAPPSADDILVPVPNAVAVSVLRIIDGDTLDVRSAETDLRVRLFGVDTPERGEACYREATERLEDLAGGVVQLLPDRRLTDPFGRELRYVYTADGRLIDEILIAEGLGVAWTADGAFRDRLVEVEEEARGAHRGCLWAVG